MNYQIFHHRLVILTVFASLSVGNYGTNGSSPVPQKLRQSINGRTFHFIIGDALPLILKRTDFIVDIGVGQLQTNDSPLRAIKTRSRNGYSMPYGVVLAQLCHQLVIGINHRDIAQIGVNCRAINRLTQFDAIRAGIRR